MASGRGRVTRVVSALRASPYNIPSVKVKIKIKKARQLTVESPFLGFLALRGKTISLSLYAFSLSTLTSFPSSLKFLLLWSTTIPTPLASFLPIPASFNSANVNPRPSRTFLLYRTVCARTAGRRRVRGRTPRVVALALRAVRRRSLRPGWSNQVRTRRCQSLRKWFEWRTLLCRKPIDYRLSKRTKGIS